MSTGGQVEAVPDSGESSPELTTSTLDGEAAPLPLENPESATPPTLRSAARTPQEICAQYGSDFLPPAPLDKAAVAIATLGQLPLNARRITPERGTCGWYIWGGEGNSSEPGFFQPLHVAHLLERCPQIMPFLALAPGWRVSLSGDAEGTEDIRPPHDVATPANVSHAAFDLSAPHLPSTRQWVWLSILLHVLAIVLFGDTTGVGSRKGDRLGGPLNVMLQGPVERGSDSRAAQPQLRAENTLRSLESRTGAPSLAVPAKDAATAESASPPPKPAEDTPAPQTLPPVIAAEVEKPVTTFVVPLAIPELTTPQQPPATKLPESIPRLDTFTPPKVVAPTKIERNIALPTELIPRLPAPSERPAPAPIEAAPKMSSFVPPKIEAETPTPAPLPPMEIPRMAPLAPPPIEREFVRPAELLPRMAPVSPKAVVESAVPTEVAPRFVAPPVVAAPPTASAATTPAPDRASEAAKTPSPPTTTATPPTAARTPAISGTPGSTGTADALAPRGSLATPSLSPPTGGGTAPRLDLDAVRQRARELAREGSGPRTLLPFNVKPKEEFKTKEQQAFDKALKRPDCKDAYAGMGLAAVVPLLWDSVSEKGCKWGGQ